MDEPNEASRQQAVLIRAAEHAGRYRAGLADRTVGPAKALDEVLAGFSGELPAGPTPPEQVIDDLVSAAEPGLMSSVGPRFFGFVTGGASPAATAADVLAAGWDQCVLNPLLAPAGWAAEQVAGSWLKQLLGLPATASVGFVTGAQAANTVGLAAARHAVLARVGWDVERDGLPGAPAVRVLAGAERHATIDRSLRLLGFGSAVVRQVPVGSDGAIDTDQLARALGEGPSGPTVVCLQAGNVNTGACDDLSTACDLVRADGGWAHVDGAFGLWAAASPETVDLVRGRELADSWSFDAHKWLNVPYDCGFTVCAHPDAHAAAMAYTAAYLVGFGPDASSAALTPESSRRARGFAVWAALRELGRDGVAELIERCCRLARRFADQLTAAGVEVANEVVLNQVLVSFGDDRRTEAVIEAVQREGVCWMAGTSWRGRRFMRISVSNYATTAADVDRSVASIVHCASFC